MTETPAHSDPAARQQESEPKPEIARIAAFSDGVLSVAITLLVLNIEVPLLPENRVDGELPRRLFDLWPDVLAYGISFAVIGRFWIVHHRFFASLVGFDGRLVTLNFVFLAFVVLIPFTSELLGRYGEHSSAVVAFAAILTCVALTNWSMHRYAVAHELVHPDARTAGAAFGDVRALAIPGVFFVSIPVGLVSPAAAQVLWVAIVLVHPAGRRAIVARSRRWTKV